MNPELAKACMEFLLRTTLQGREVPVFAQVVAAIEKMAEAQPERPANAPPEA